MADERTFDVLLSEFRRVGVDPDTFSAMLALRPEDALRALLALPNDAGPSAFLSQLRANGHVTNASAEARVAEISQRLRDKSA